MMTLEDIRQYISGLGIAEDEHVYIGKLDNKQERSIGVYNRKGEGTSQIPLGGMEHSSYDIRRISLLIHWNKSVAETEEAKTQAVRKATLGNTSGSG